jgi:hypothetical protein
MSRGLRRRSVGIGLLLLAIARPSSADDKGVSETHAFAPAEFAYGMNLTPAQGSALQTFKLPQEVLMHLDADRTQLAVFNHAGEQVPHAVRDLTPTWHAETTQVRLPFFPIYGDTTAGAAAEPVTVQVQRKNDGTLVRVEVGQHGAAHDVAPAAATRPIIAYVIDASALRQDIQQLKFEVSAPQTTFTWPLTLDTSADLDTFRSTSVHGTVLSLEHDGQRVESNQLELDGLSSKYLRLRWSLPEAPATLESVTAVLTSTSESLPLDTRELAGTAVANRAGTWEFELGADLVVAKADVLLQKNSVLQATLEGVRAEGAASALYTGTFFDLVQDGETLHSRAIDAGFGRYRKLRLTASNGAGGLGSGPVNLRAQVVPEQLLFVARGEGPFTLAFGHVGAVPSAFSEAALTAPLGLRARDLPVSSATAAPLFELGGPQALTPRAPAPNWTKPILWSVLVAAVALLAALSVRLLRRVDTPP